MEIASFSLLPLGRFAADDFSPQYPLRIVLSFMVSMNISICRGAKRVSSGWIFLSNLTLGRSADLASSLTDLSWSWLTYWHEQLLDLFISRDWYLSSLPFQGQA